MVTRGRKISRGQRPDVQTGPSLFDDEDQADLRRGVVGIHLAQNRSDGAWTACGISVGDVPGWTASGRMPKTLTLIATRATCPDCLWVIGRR